MTPFSIRAATPEDEAEVTALLSASYPALMAPAYDADILTAILPMMTRANPALLASGTYFLAVSAERQIIGCGGWTREQPGTAGAVINGLGHIRHFGTHPDWTGRGVGREVMETCKRTAREAGLSRFECYSSLNAQTFYAALGFNRIEREESALSGTPPIESVLMGCEI